MTLKKLLQTHTWQTILSKLLEIYPNAEKHIQDYETVINKLALMSPEGTDISIIISIEKDEDAEYIDVSGLQNHPKNKEENYSQGIELVPWRKWLGMEISKESLREFSELEIIVYCLYEMTYMGFSEEDITKTVSRIQEK